MAPPLVRVSGRRSSSEVCCRGKNLLTCQDAFVDPAILNTKESITLAGIVVDHVSNIAPNGRVYTNSDGDEAIVTYNPTTGNVFGTFKTSTGKSFAIEKCGGGYTWIEFDVVSFKPDTAIRSRARSRGVFDFKADQLQAKSAADNVTASTYSVMFYYTPEFAAITSDIPGFIDQVLAETNQGYANSGVPLTVTRFCIEAATINDIQDTSTFLSAFTNMKNSISELRNSADAAVLLSVDFNSCGVAWLNTISSGDTVSICQKSCALGYFSFGHELGHNMGLHHNREVAANSDFPHGHGHLIQAGSGASGARTILAYSATGHRQRVNYYSNPSLTYPATGTPLGVDGQSNNAAVLLENRMAMQAVGDEAASCNDGSLTPAPTGAPTTSSPGTGSTASSGCGNCVFPFTFNRRVHNTCTTIDGDATPWCATQVDANGNLAGGSAWEYCTSPSCPGVVPPAIYVHPTNAVGSCCKYQLSLSDPICSLAACGVPNVMNRNRIVGGVETQIGEYPWQASDGVNSRNGNTRDMLYSSGCSTVWQRPELPGLRRSPDL